jgi:aspartate/glutamate racemase
MRHMTVRGTTPVSPHVGRGSPSEPRRREATSWHAPRQTLQAQTARHEHVLANVHALPTPTAHPSADAYPAETSTAYERQP